MSIAHPYGDVRPFFDQLTVFSSRVFTKLGLPPAGSPWGRPMPAQPHAMKGAVIHFTAAPDIVSPLRWLCDRALNPDGQESCHVIVGKRRYPQFDGLDLDLPLIAALPVTVVQVRPVTALANHATWANSVTYGIENDSTGVTGKGELCEAFGGNWAAYPLLQLQTNVALVQAYNAYCGGTFQPSWVLGHEHLETTLTKGYAHNKRDPGPLYPMLEIREAVFGIRRPGGVLDGAAQVTSAYAARQSLVKDYQFGGGGPKIGSKLAMYDLMHVLTLDQPLPTGAMDVRQCGKLYLGLLGYYTSPPDTAAFEAGDSVSTRIAQQALGLEVDGVLGPKTLAALCARAVDRLGKV